MFESGKFDFKNLAKIMQHTYRDELVDEYTALCNGVSFSLLVALMSISDCFLF